jgi:hypothetical protein
MRRERATRITLFAVAAVVGLLSMPSPGARASADTVGDATLPPARGLGGMSVDPMGNVVLFGGYVARTSQVLGDTWTWDGTSWTRQHPAHSPSARANYAMAYDAARNQVVLFGGEDGYTTFDDTWVWDGVTWTLQHPAHTPLSTNIGEAMAYDGARREIVLTSIGSPDDVTWIWDGTDWQDASPASPPPGRWLPQLAFDAARKQVVQFGGAYDCFESLCAYDDTWLWNGVDWTELDGIQHPPARYLNVVGYDPRRRAVVVFGGNGGAGGSGFLGDTWTSTGPDWVEADPVHSPLPREAAMMAWDRHLHVLLLFGGRDAPGGSYRDFQDTWAWNGTDWTCMSGCP